MSALRLLALSYLACASAFVLAGAWQAHPEVRRGLADAAAGMRRAVIDPALSELTRQDMALIEDRPVRIAIQPPTPAELRVLPHEPMAPLPPRRVVAAEPRIAAPFPPAITILPDLPPPAHVARIPEPPAITTPAIVQAAQRLKASLSPEMLQGFKLFLYVSKADHGPLAQRLYVFRKTQGNDLTLLYDWAASTGRERDEVNPRGRRSFTSTPRGYYQFDPDRMYRRYRSYSWDQDMPNAMFFNWEREGLKTGLAIHSASGDDIARLGQRASAGCVHLSPQNAALLYDLIRRDYRGPTPRFAYDARTQTMSNKGALMHDRDGRLVMADGYQALVFIENYGGEDVVASLF